MAFHKPNLTNLNGHGLSLCHLTLGEIVHTAIEGVSRQIDHVDIRTNNRKTPGLAVDVTQEPDLAGISDKTTPSADSSAGIFLAMLNGSDVVFLDGVSQKKFKLADLASGTITYIPLITKKNRCAKDTMKPNRLKSL